MSLMTGLRFPGCKMGINNAPSQWGWGEEKKWEAVGQKLNPRPEDEQLTTKGAIL